MAKNEVKYRPATMAEIEGRDTDLYMDGEHVWVLLIQRSETIGEGESKLDYIMLTNMKKVQVEDLQVIDNNNNEPISENTTMAQNVKAADLIGKTIVNGNMKYVVIEAIDDEKIMVEFTSGDRVPVAMPMRVEQVDKLLAGGWKFADGQPTPGPSQVGGEKTTNAAEDVEEVEDIKPKAKTVKMGEPKAKKPKAKTEKPKAEQPKGSQYTYSTYTNKKGKTCAKIAGFKDDDAVYQKETATALHGAPMGGLLLFGKAYVAFAKQLCDALNEGKSIDECKAMLAAYDEKRAADKAQAKAEREAGKPDGKVYTDADVAEMLKKIMAGGDIPEDIKKAMAA